MTTLGPESSGTSLAQRVNIVPMGPIVDTDMTQFVLRPFRTSTTYRNLDRTREGVFHVTDDALLIAQAAVGRVTPDDHTPVRSAGRVSGLVLTDACRYYELKVVELDDRAQRTTIRAHVVTSVRLRDFFGFNRARHAVLEAAILATRVHLTTVASVLKEFDRLAVVVDKTGAQREHQAMALLYDFIEHGDTT